MEHLGFADEGIARMEAIDQRHDARWRTGLAYVQERGGFYRFEWPRVYGRN